MANRIEYQYSSSGATHNADYLIKPLLQLLSQINTADKRVFELGCGNGHITNQISKLGFDITAVDTSESGIAVAKESYPACSFHVGSAYDDLANIYGTYDCLVSLEVVEHVFSPKAFADTAYKLLNTGGTAVISTPYHGYLKNLAVALLGKFDAHVDPLWEGGHIKFWSKQTLSQLLQNAGFSEIEFHLVGRVPWLAKSMIAIAKK